MLLEPSDIVHYLLGRGRLSPDCVVNPGVMVLDTGRRNRAFQIILQGRKGLFVKQIRRLDNFAIETLCREAACYQLLQSGSQPPPTFMPRFYDFDPARFVLMLELLDGAENLAEFYHRTREFPPDIGRLLGEHLASYHSVLNKDPSRQQSVAAFPRQIPWSLSFHRQTMNSEISIANQELRAMLNTYPDFCSLLDELRQEWRHDSLIHGDLKWDNCLVSKSDKDRLLHVVDWEISDVGDPCWDIGAIFHAYVATWASSIPLSNGRSFDEALSEASCPLESMHDSIAAFWHSYVARRALDPNDWQQVLTRSVRYAAARMIQTVFERLQDATRTTALSVILLQLSWNILRDPRSAATQLLSLNLPL